MMEQSNTSIDHMAILNRLQELKRIHMLQTERLYQQQLNVSKGSENDNNDNDFTIDTAGKVKFLKKRFEDSSFDESKITEKDLMDGVRLLNTQSKLPTFFKANISTNETIINSEFTSNEFSLSDASKSKTIIEEIPSLKLFSKVSENPTGEEVFHESKKPASKRPFLRKGVGMVRFKMSINDIGLVKNRKLPWLKKNKSKEMIPKIDVDRLQAKIIRNVLKPAHKRSISEGIHTKNSYSDEVTIQPPNMEKKSPEPQLKAKFESHKSVVHQIQQTPPKQKYPEDSSSRGKTTWAKMLTNEQDSYLRQLKQSSYYKRYGDSPRKDYEALCVNESPTKLSDSIISSKESADQRLFELLEQKLMNSSFTSTSSFMCRLFSKNMNDSGESTPNVAHKFIRSHPQALKLHPDPCDLPRRVVIPDEQQSCSSEEDESSKETSAKSHSGPIDNETQWTDYNEDSTSNTETEETCRYINEEEQSSILKENDLEQSSTLKENDLEQSSTLKENDLELKEHACKHCMCIMEVGSGDTTDRTQSINRNNEEIAFTKKESDIFATGEMLKEKLHELEDEMIMFRQEYSQLAVDKQNFEEQKEQFMKQKAEYEKKFYEEKVLTEYHLAEEKENVAKLKQSYEQQMKDMKNRSNKKEREEIARLKKNIETIEHENRNKDAKSGAAIARLRNQVKTLEKENTELKTKNEKVMIENRRLQQSNVRTRRLTNIKTLAEINKSLSKSILENGHNPFDDKKKNEIFLHPALQRGSVSAKKPSNPKEKTARLKTKSTPNLSAQSSYAKYFSLKDSEIRNNIFESSDEDFADALDSVPRERSDNFLDEIDVLDSSPDSLSAEYFKRSSISCPSRHVADKDISDRIISDTSIIDREMIPKYSIESKGAQSNKYLNFEDICQRFDRKNTKQVDNECEKRNESTTPKDDFNLKDNEINGRASTSSFGSKLLCSKSLKEDGSEVIEYTNGNMKMISANGSHVKFFYFNGDIKETFMDEGMIKYYYAKTKTYHTTYKDGLQVLQFPDGQLERRHPDGSNEVHLPNGSVRFVPAQNSSNLKEEWTFPDGTAVSINCDGEQVIRFPNGQIEVHNQEHKRREFPDGTVKLVYADGTTETRFASGRVRVKDKNGKLIIDSGSDSVSFENCVPKTA